MNRVTLRKWTLSLFAVVSVIGLAACGNVDLRAGHWLWFERIRPSIRAFDSARRHRTCRNGTAMAAASQKSCGSNQCRRSIRSPCFRQAQKLGRGSGMAVSCGDQLPAAAFEGFYRVYKSLWLAVYCRKPDHEALSLRAPRSCGYAGGDLEQSAAGQSGRCHLSGGRHFVCLLADSTAICFGKGDGRGLFPWRMLCRAW